MVLGVSITPVMYVDPTGEFWDYIFDVVSIGWSLWYFYEDPSWSNFGWLALDVVFAVVPLLTGSRALNAYSKIDDISDITKLTTKADDVIVIGQAMKTRVISEALNLGADYYHGYEYYNDIAKGSEFMAKAYGYIDNIKFIAMQSLRGTKFIDIGMDITRIGEKGL